MDDRTDANAADRPRAELLLGAYRDRGHLAADIDPLAEAPPPGPKDLDPARWGFTGADRDRSLALGGLLGLDRASLGELEARAREIYCGPIGIEFAHLDSPDERDFLARAMEAGRPAFKPAIRRAILDQLSAADAFEQVLHVKMPTAKRYGMEGSESQLPLSECLLERAAAAGVTDIVLGPMHRGRTTFMATFMEKPSAAVIAHFSGAAPFPEEIDAAGDAAYHLGYSVERSVGTRSVRISMPSHPSHVETVIPVALGKARARQDLRGPEGRERVLGLMMHTDGGFSGQGIAAEALQLAALEGYSVGGSIHVIANNQIAFTTRAEDGRSSRYCSDFAKAIGAPVLHVNADDPEAAVRAAGIAFDFWLRFRRDVVIDLVCYRRRGHNEMDEPRFTQPAMYHRIAALTPVREAYAARLVAEGVVEAGAAQDMLDRHLRHFGDAFAGAQGHKTNTADRFGERWSGLRARSAEDDERQPDTGVALDDLRRIAAAASELPDGFDALPKARDALAARRAAVEAGEGIDWATAESLAFGALLAEGTPVRLTGQDARRGTFSQRHATLRDQSTDVAIFPLRNASHDGTRFDVFDSPLSEAAVMAFEYGYSLEDPGPLVLWEAQFGDFANGAQPIIDHYLASGEAKWLRSSGLTLLLPNGAEGAGPEHSSARLERFLQLCARGNLQVAYPTTPANYFHLLRRQVRRDFRTPLVVMTPKGLLRHRQAVSTLAQFGPGTRFEPVLNGIGAEAASVRRAILCSGRIYYELEKARAERGRDDTAIIRLEELYPFPEAGLRRALAPFGECELVWCQEEPRNMGAWSFVQPLLDGAGLGAGPVRYTGRPESATPASAIPERYRAEQDAVIDAAFA